MQEHLFHEDFRAALEHAIKALGGYQAVGATLWPSKKLEAADRWLRDCLSNERPAKLEIDEIVEILRLARAEGIHCALHQLCDDAGYERPSIAAGKTQSQMIAQKMQKIAAQFKHLADEHAAALEAEQTPRMDFRAA